MHLLLECGIFNKIDTITIKQKNLFSKIYFSFMLYVLKRKRDYLVKYFEREKKRLFEKLEKQINAERGKLDYLEGYPESESLKRLESKAEYLIIAKRILDENMNLYLGAIGEQKAVDELKMLPDGYVVINNFQLKMDEPIYNKQTGQRIYSIQADHIIIGPSGVFLVETKNWSRDSIKSLDLYSPVEQIKRSSFALFCFLNSSVNTGILSLFRDSWGERKISIRNILLMVNAKPDREYQYVKLLSLSELCGYIQYFKPVFNGKEVNQIVEQLMSSNHLS